MKNRAKNLESLIHAFDDDHLIVHYMFRSIQMYTLQIPSLQNIHF